MFLEPLVLFALVVLFVLAVNNLNDLRSLRREQQGTLEFLASQFNRLSKQLAEGRDARARQPAPMPAPASETPLTESHLVESPGGAVSLTESRTGESPSDETHSTQAPIAETESAAVEPGAATPPFEEVPAEPASTVPREPFGYQPPTHAPGLRT